MYVEWEKVGKMLIGEYIHTIDEKNRMSLPFKFRRELGRKLVLTPGLDQCLFLFPSKEWHKVARSLSGGTNELSFLRADQRKFNRILFGQAAEVEVDSIGRVLLPEFLKQKIGIKDTAAVVGLSDRVEIWNERVWREFKKKADSTASALAEKLADRHNAKHE